MVLCPSVCSSQVAAQPITVVCNATRVYMPILGSVVWTFYHLLCKKGWTDRRQSLKPTPIHAKCTSLSEHKLSRCDKLQRPSCMHHSMTRSSAVAERPRDALCQSKPCEMLHERWTNFIIQPCNNRVTFKVIQGHCIWHDAIRHNDTSY